MGAFEHPSSSHPSTLRTTYETRDGRYLLTPAQNSNKKKASCVVWDEQNFKTCKTNLYNQTCCRISSICSLKCPCLTFFLTISHKVDLCLLPSPRTQLFLVARTILYFFKREKTREFLVSPVIFQEATRGQVVLSIQLQIFTSSC